MKENFARTIGIVIFFGLFIGLLSLVGNPAKEETGIIFLIILVSAGFVYFKLVVKKLIFKSLINERLKCIAINILVL